MSTSNSVYNSEFNAYCHHCKQNQFDEKQLYSCSLQFSEYRIDTTNVKRKRKIQNCSKIYCQRCIAKHYPSFATSRLNWWCPCCQEACTSKMCVQNNKQSKIIRKYIGHNIPNKESVPAILEPVRIDHFANNLGVDLTGCFNIIQNAFDLTSSTFGLNFDHVNIEVQIFQFVLGTCQISSMGATSIYEIVTQFFQWRKEIINQLYHKKEEEDEEYDGKLEEYIVEILDKILAIIGGDSVHKSSNGILYGLNLLSYNAKQFFSHSLLVTMRTNTFEFLSKWNECTIQSVSAEWESQESWYKGWNELLCLNSKGLTYLKYYHQVLYFLPNGNTWRPGTCTQDMFTGSTNSQWLMYQVFAEIYECWPKPKTEQMNYSPPAYREEDLLTNIVLQCGYSNCVNPYCIVGIYNTEARQIVSDQSVKCNALVFENALKRYNNSTEAKHHSVPQKQWLRNLLGYVRSPQTISRCTGNNYIGPRLHSPCFIEKDDDDDVTNKFRYFSVIWYFFGYKVPMPILHHSVWHLDRTCAYPQCISPQCYRTLHEMKSGYFFQPLYNHHIVSFSNFFPYQINYPGSFRFAGDISFSSYPTKSQISLFEEQKQLLIPQLPESNREIAIPQSPSLQNSVVSIEELYFYEKRCVKLKCRRIIQSRILNGIYKTSDFSRDKQIDFSISINMAISNEEDQSIISRLRKEQTFYETKENDSNLNLFQSIAGLNYFHSPFIKTLSHRITFEQIQVLQKSYYQQWPCWTCQKTKNKPIIINCEKFKIPIREFLCALTIKQWELTWNMFFQTCPCENNNKKKKFKNCCFPKLKWSCNGESINCIQPAHIIYTPVSQTMLDTLISSSCGPKQIKNNTTLSSDVKQEYDPELLLGQCLLYITLPGYGLLCPKTQRDFNFMERIKLTNLKWTVEQVNEFDQNWELWLKPYLVSTGLVRSSSLPSSLAWYQVKTYLQKRFEQYYERMENVYVQIGVWSSINLLNGIIFKKLDIYKLMQKCNIFNPITFFHMITIYRNCKNVLVRPSLTLTGVQLKYYQLLQLINLGPSIGTYNLFNVIPIEKIQKDFQNFQKTQLECVHQLLFYDIRRICMNGDFLKEWLRIANILSFKLIQLQFYSPKQESSFGKVFYSSNEKHWVVSAFEHGSIVLAILYGNWIQTITDARIIPTSFHKIISKYPVNFKFKFSSNSNYPLSSIPHSLKLHDISLHYPTLFAFRPCSSGITMELLEKERLKLINNNNSRYIIKQLVEAELNPSQNLSTKYMVIQFCSISIAKSIIEFSLEKSFRKPLNWSVPKEFYGYFEGTSSIDTGLKFHFLLLPRISFLEQLMCHHLTSQLHHNRFCLDPNLRLNTHDLQILPCSPFVVEAFFSNNPNLVYYSIKLMYAWITWTFPNDYYDHEWEQQYFMTPRDVSFGTYYLLPKLLRKLFSKRSELQQSYNDGFGANNSLHRPELKFAKHKPPPIASPNPSLSGLAHILRSFLGCRQLELDQTEIHYLIHEFNTIFGDRIEYIEKTNNSIELEQREWNNRLFRLRTSLKEGPVKFRTVTIIEELIWIAAHPMTPILLTKYIFSTLKRKNGDDQRNQAKKYIPTNLKNKWANLSTIFKPSGESSISNPFPNRKIDMKSQNRQSLAIPLRVDETKMSDDISYMTELITILEYGFDHLYSRNWTNGEEEKNFSIDVTTQSWYPFKPMQYIYPCALLNENNQDGSNKTIFLYWQHWFPLYDNLSNLQLSSETSLHSKYEDVEREFEAELIHFNS